MILVNTIFNLATPDSPAAEFISVTTLCIENIARLYYEEAVRFCRERFYDLDGKPLNGGRA